MPLKSLDRTQNLFYKGLSFAIPTSTITFHRRNEHIKIGFNIVDQHEEYTALVVCEVLTCVSDNYLHTRLFSENLHL